MECYSKHSNATVVSNPSYKNARILELLPESLSDFITPDQNLLCESEEFKNFIDTEKLEVFENTAVNQFLDQIINENFLRVITKKIQFKL